MSIKITDIKPGDFVLARVKVIKTDHSGSALFVRLIAESYWQASARGAEIRCDGWIPFSSVQSIAPREIRVSDRVRVIGHALTVVALNGRHAWCQGDDGTFGTYLIADLSFIEEGSPA